MDSLDQARTAIQKSVYEYYALKVKNERLQSLLDWIENMDPQVVDDARAALSVNQDGGKAENKRLRDALTLAEAEILSVHSQYGDEANALDHSAALRSIRALSDKTDGKEV